MNYWVEVTGSVVSILMLCGVVFNYSVIKPLNQSVQGLRDAVECLRRQLHDTEQKRQEMAERLSRVEASVSHMNRRLTTLEMKGDGHGS